MNSRRQILTILILIAATMATASTASANGTLIRWHKMGEEEGGVNNGAVTTTLDSPVPDINGMPDIQPLDLNATNTPTYRTITGRPDGGSGIGIEFAAAQQESLSGLSLNWPQESALSDSQGGLYDLAGIADRGFQFWVRPTSTAVQSLVMDTNQHGVRIDSNGKFSMRYANQDYESTVTVVPNTWYHIEVVRPNGAASGSRMYINGSAVVVGGTTGDYASDQATNMTVGSNTAGDGEFFSGIIDDLRMFVLGTTDNGLNYGSFNFASDNAYAASTVSGIKGVAGDVTNNGVLDAADKTAFIAGWMSRRLVNGVQIGDMTSRSQGDLNLDGITNIKDLLLLQNALSGAGIGTITPDELVGVPEPATAMLLILATLPLACRRRRGSPAQLCDFMHERLWQK
jgi:hypothetical protein